MFVVLEQRETSTKLDDGRQVAIAFVGLTNGVSRRIGQIKDREEVVGNQTRVKVVKNMFGMATGFDVSRGRHGVD